MNRRSRGMKAHLIRLEGDAWRSLVIGHAVEAPVVLGVVVLALGLLLSVLGDSFAGPLTIAGFGAVAGGGLCWLAVRATVSRPLSQITRTTESLANQDATALSDMLTGIAQGNLTDRLSVNRTRVGAVSACSAEVRRLGEVVDS